MWRRGAARLIEQGRLMWLLGEGLSAALAAQGQGWTPRDEESLAADLFGWTQRALSNAPGSLAAGQATRQPAAPRPGSARPTPLALALLQESLNNLRCPVMWLGSREFGGQWVSMALAAGVDGFRRVLALAPGSVRDQGVAEGLLADLAARGWESEGMLVITEGSRTLDRVLSRLGNGKIRVAHCRARLRREIIGHFPETSRERWGQELDAAWSLPVLEADALLLDLERRWAAESPGAAERLARSREASLMTARLGVSSPLKERLESAGTLRMAFKKALRGGPPGPALPALTMGVPVWLQRVRRLAGWHGLELLAHTLRSRPLEPKNDAAPQA